MAPSCHLVVALPWLLLLLFLPNATHAILPTAAIDILLPDSNTGPITLLASQALFGSDLAPYSQRYHSFTDDDDEDQQRVPGVGLLAAFPPEDDAYLCNESDGLADYSKKEKEVLGPFHQSAILVPRGQCSFERKALSAQRLGAAAIVIYGTLSSRYSLNYTNSTIDCQDESCNDAKSRTDYSLHDVLWPLDKYDYDCDFGKALLPQNDFNALNFVTLPGGYEEQNDGYLTGPSQNNFCVRYDSANAQTNAQTKLQTNIHTNQKPFAKTCASQRCLVTGNNVTTNDDTVLHEACCAWDLHVLLYSDSTIADTNELVKIPAVFITMQEAVALLDMVRGANDSGSGSGDPVVLSIYARYRPQYNASAILIWALGVFVAWIASYHSSADYRKAGTMLMLQRILNARMDSLRENDPHRHHPTNTTMMGDRTTISGSRDTEHRGRQRARSRSPNSNPPSHQENTTAHSLEITHTSSNASAIERGEERTIYRAAYSATPITDQPMQSMQPMQQPPPRQDPDSLELTASHALGFIVMASTSLLILFFFKIYSIVKIMYAFGCSSALAQILLHPGLYRLCRKFQWQWPMKDLLTEEGAAQALARGGCKGRYLHCLWNVIGPISPVDITAMLASYSIGAIWLYISFTVPHPDTVVFYWVVQDIFGLCMCMLFLMTIRLNSIRVGSILLVVAFLYDIFFVFVTPLLTKNGESIMVNVATSGGPPKADPSWCEKYPWSTNCRGGDPLPMLFAVPRIGDYQGGSSLLGLGDIVLPGLLLSFASRFDEAKRLIGVAGGGSGRTRNHACADSSDGSTAGGVAGGRSSSNPFSFFCRCCCRHGYFGPVMVAYAIGLLMANAAVYIMEMGQPALLYLVPCCLGTMVYLGHKAGELNDLWEGPRVIRAADALLFGEPSVESGEEEEEDDNGPRKGVEGDEMAQEDEILKEAETALPAEEDNNGDGPLLQLT